MLEPSVSAIRRRKSRAAGLSIASNVVLIALKLTAGIVTGSVALLTEAVHSAIDLLASVLAFVAVRKSAAPADETHRYGHDKFENLTAVIEAMLILTGSAVIMYEAVRRLFVGSNVESLEFGIIAIGISAVANVAVSAYLAKVARETESAALAGDALHLRADSYTSFAVFVGLALVAITDQSWIDSAVAALVASSIMVMGLRVLLNSSRVLVDEALPVDELAQIRETILGFGPRGVVGFHKLRTRRAGRRRYVDMHVQFCAGTSLESAHEIAHEIDAAISVRLDNTDVLIHLEPEDRLTSESEVPSERPLPIDPT